MTGLRELGVPEDVVEELLSATRMWARTKGPAYTTKREAEWRAGSLRYSRAVEAFHDALWSMCEQETEAVAQKEWSDAVMTRLGLLEGWRQSSPILTERDWATLRSLGDRLEMVESRIASIELVMLENVG